MGQKCSGSLLIPTLNQEGYSWTSDGGFGVLPAAAVFGLLGYGFWMEAVRSLITVTNIKDIAS